MAAPYSIRARPSAPVATPVEWHELGRTEASSYTVRNIFRRLGQKVDPWVAVHTESRPLTPARRRLDPLRQ
ncbi:MAG: hypothetical protein ABR592_06710 [Nitriliruptorales bacterium]